MHSKDKRISESLLLAQLWKWWFQVSAVLAPLDWIKGSVFWCFGDWVRGHRRGLHTEKALPYLDLALCSLTLPDPFKILLPPLSFSKLGKWSEWSLNLNMVQVSPKVLGCRIKNYSLGLWMNVRGVIQGPTQGQVICASLLFIQRCLRTPVIHSL